MRVLVGQEEHAVRVPARRERPEGVEHLAVDAPRPVRVVRHRPVFVGASGLEIADVDDVDGAVDLDLVPDRLPDRPEAGLAHLADVDAGAERNAGAPADRDGAGVGIEQVGPVDDARAFVRVERRSAERVLGEVDDRIVVIAAEDQVFIGGCGLEAPHTHPVIQIVAVDLAGVVHHPARPELLGASFPEQDAARRLDRGLPDDPEARFRAPHDIRALGKRERRLVCPAHRRG